MSLYCFAIYYCSTAVPLLVEMEGDKVTLILNIKLFKAAESQHWQENIYFPSGVFMISEDTSGVQLTIRHLKLLFKIP